MSPDLPNWRPNCCLPQMHRSPNSRPLSITGVIASEATSRCTRAMALLVARTSDDLVVRSRQDGEPDHHVTTPRGPAIALSLPDGRRFLVRRPGRPPPPGPILTFALIALGIGVGAYPVVRRLTRRLERLQTGVNAWGAGNLGTRVAVEGRDEVAQLAASFNDAAARIEQLVNVHKSLLANASHELRSPLARIRLGVELMAVDPSPARQSELARDIGELDQLIDEILLASRLESGSRAAARAGGLHGRRCGRVRTLRRAAAGRHRDHRRQCATAAAPRTQPARKCRALRRRVASKRHCAHPTMPSRSKCSIAVPASAPPSENAYSSRSIGPPAQARRTAASVSACRWCGRLLASTAAKCTVFLATAVAASSASVLARR